MGAKAKEFGIRLKNLLENKDMTQKELAEKLFIQPSAVSNYVQGTRLPNFEVITSIAKYFNVSIDYLLGNRAKSDAEQPKLEKIPGAEKLDPENYKIPILGTVRAGMPALITDDNIIGYVNVDDSYKRYGELFALKIKGDSMQPRMFEGDIAIAKRTPDVESGKIAVVIVNGDEATVKKIMKSSSGIALIPLNSAYDIITYSNDEIINKPVIIVGQILEVRGIL